MNTLDASTALHEWQRLRGLNLTPKQRIERLVSEFFLVPLSLDVLYIDTMQAVEREMVDQ